jgi:predicted transglutaminase-like cysteine proteinase
MAAIEWPVDCAERGTAVHVVHAWAARRFIYTRDLERWGTSDHWETPADLIEDLAFRGGKVSGDCDAFAMLCRVALDRMGHPNRLIYCLDETGGGHLVCECGGYVLDNRHPRVVTRSELERIGYRWISMSGFAAGDPWTEIQPKGAQA